MAYTTINKSSEYFNTKLYTGTGSSNSVTGVGFQPDWIWQKSRSASQDGRIFDAVRGGSKLIYPSLSNAEATDAQLITSFDSDGFTMGSSGSNANDSSVTYVSWNWLANGAGSSNTDGSITSTVSANTTSGFSIVKYTGTGSNATVGHGLGVAPSIVLVKNLDDGTQQWSMYNKNLPLTDILILNSTNGAFNPSDNDFQDTAPTANVFYVNGGATRTNVSSQNFIAYCFAEKKGFSKFGSYTGNGNADGTFVYTGFKPALLIRKRTDASNDWYINDNKRAGYNPQNDYLFPNSTQAESALQRFDFLSNGFKIRTTDGGDNASGGTYIYMAFAENPLVGTNGVPATAR